MTIKEFIKIYDDNEIIGKFMFRYDFDKLLNELNILQKI